jgi:hypothetical protein
MDISSILLPFGIFCGHFGIFLGHFGILLGHLGTFWGHFGIFSRFGMLCQGKSGNPGLLRSTSGGGK